jgi:hypothetical protein
MKVRRRRRRTEREKEKERVREREFYDQRWFAVDICRKTMKVRRR